MHIHIFVIALLRFSRSFFFFFSFDLVNMHLVLLRLTSGSLVFFRSSGDISIHQRCMNSLTEVYKYNNRLFPETMNEVFSTGANICNI